MSGIRAEERQEPVRGAKSLTRLQPIDISEAYANLLESGRRDGKGGLSPRSVHRVHRVLHSALSQAERWKLIVRNPAALLESETGPRSSASLSTPSTPLLPLRYSTPRASAGSSYPCCWRRSAGCDGAKSLRCDGRQSIWTTASLPSSPVLSRPTPAPSGRRKPRAAGLAQSPCPQWQLRVAPARVSNRRRSSSAWASASRRSARRHAGRWHAAAAEQSHPRFRNLPGGPRLEARTAARSHGTPTRRTCSRPAFTPRLPASASAIARSGSRSTFSHCAAGNAGRSRRTC